MTRPESRNRPAPNSQFLGGSLGRSATVALRRCPTGFSRAPLNRGPAEPCPTSEDGRGRPLVLRPEYSIEKCQHSNQAHPLAYWCGPRPTSSTPGWIGPSFKGTIPSPTVRSHPPRLPARSYNPLAERHFMPSLATKYCQLGRCSPSVISHGEAESDGAKSRTLTLILTWLKASRIDSGQRPIMAPDFKGPRRTHLRLA